MDSPNWTQTMQEINMIPEDLLASLPTYTSDSRSLGAQIWENAVPGAHRNHFWPGPIWKSLVTKEAILNEVSSRTEYLEQTEAINLVHRIRGELPSETSIMIFTIFALLDEVDVFVNHLRGCSEAVLDHHLPLRSEKNSLLRNNGTDISCCFMRRGPAFMEMFFRLQRQLSVPVFSFDLDGEDLRTTVLDKQDILPWCQEAMITRPRTGTSMSGGFGYVSRVDIHPLCHKFHHVLRKVRLQGFISPVVSVNTVNL